MQICTHLLVCAIWCTEHRWEESQKSQPWMMDWLRLHKAREQINKAQTNKVNVEEYIYYFFMKYRALSEKRVLRTPRSRFQLRYLWIIFLKPRETHQSSSTCRLNSLAGRKVRVQGPGLGSVFLAHLSKLNSKWIANAWRESFRTSLQWSDGNKPMS